MQVSIVTGVCVPHDAISDAVLQERDALRSDGHGVAIYCQGTTFTADPDIYPGDNAWLMTNHNRYRECDLVIFHFGTGYELFDALLLKDRGIPRVVRFHNITPPQLLGGSARERARRGLDQVVVAALADHVWCDSRFNQLTLLDLGVPEPMTSVLELCVPDVDALLAESGHARTPTVAPRRFLYVGRFVGAKGVVDLADAFERSGTWRSGARLVMAGNAATSDPIVVRELEDRAATRCDGALEIIISPPSSRLAELYDEADVFVMPSHHEGFCVPVIEAAARGLRVIATSGGALPETVGCGVPLLEPGDVEGLTRALRESVTDLDRGTTHVRGDLARFGWASFRSRFLAAVRDVAVPDRRPATPPALSEMWPGRC